LKRDEQLSLLDKGIEAVQIFIETISKMNESDRYHSEEELANATSVVNEVKEWKAKKVAEQQALEPHVDPVLTTRDIQKKMKDVEAALRKLTTKKKPKVTKKKDSNKKNETQEEPKKDQEPKNEQTSSEKPVDDIHDEL
jgi:hypothetical protein